VGGGSIDEYGNLQEWVARTSGGGTGGVVGTAGGGSGLAGAVPGAARRRVVYGSTEIVTAEDFVNDELARLGSEP